MEGSVREQMRGVVSGRGRGERGKGGLKYEREGEEKWVRIMKQRTSE